MFTEALHLLKTRKIVYQGLFFFLFFIVIYTMLDSFNMSYAIMNEIYGPGLVSVNIALNLLMSSLTALLLSFSTINAHLKGGESKGSNLSYVSVLFGILTYGCTPCVIAFFASLGIAFSVIALPFAGLPYKFISLGLILIGLIWTYREIQYGVCKVKPQK